VCITLVSDAIPPTAAFGRLPTVCSRPEADIWNLKTIGHNAGYRRIGLESEAASGHKPGPFLDAFPKKGRRGANPLLPLTVFAQSAQGRNG
jgi:hypothetical protein